MSAASDTRAPLYVTFIGCDARKCLKPYPFGAASRTPLETTHRITRHELYDLVWSRPLPQLSAELGISGNALAKICDRVLVPHPPRGYWSAGTGTRRDVRPPLPAAPDDCDEDILISSRRAGSRRGQSRMSTEARADHIRGAAADMVLASGVGSVTMKAVARRAGISEALAYRYFPSVLDLLADMARREQAQMAQMQADQVAGHDDYSARARASVVGFLDYVEKRRGLLQALLAHAELRRLLNTEHRTRIAANTETYAARLHDQSGVPLEVGAPGWQILRAAATRAGKLMASRKVSREQAGRLAGAIMDGARQRLIAWGPAALGPAGSGSRGPTGRHPPAGARGADPGPGAAGP